MVLEPGEEAEGEAGQGLGPLPCPGLRATLSRAGSMSRRSWRSWCCGAIWASLDHRRDGPPGDPGADHGGRGACSSGEALSEEEELFRDQEKLAAYIKGQYGFYEYGTWALVRKTTACWWAWRV